MWTPAKTVSQSDGGHGLSAAGAPLFRAEVMAERQTQWLGTVLLEPRVSAVLFTLAALLAAAAIVALLFLGSFTRKARIEGWLAPEQGLMRVYAPHAGVITRIHANEGSAVKKGEPLLSLSAEVRSETIGATVEEIVQQLAARRDSTLAAKPLQEQLFDQKAADLQHRLDALDSQREHLAAEVDLQRDRLAVSSKELKRERAMRKRDLIPVTRLQRTEQEHLEQAGRLAQLERAQATLKNERAQVQGALSELPMLRQTAIAEIERSTAALEQELAEAEARRNMVIVAPQDGTVTAILTEPGGNAFPTTPLMSLVPAGSKLQAQLFSPSRAIGFVRTGQRVAMRYQSFPYQKFGSYGGVVASISRSPVSPSDLPRQLTGLSSLEGTSEPVYRVTVDLDRQSAMAYGEEVPLQPGMQLEADVTIETRRLIEWVLDPLYTLTGKMSR